MEAPCFSKDLPPLKLTVELPYLNPLKLLAFPQPFERVQLSVAIMVVQQGLRLQHLTSSPVGSFVHSMCWRSCRT